MSETRVIFCTHSFSTMFFRDMLEEREVITFTPCNKSDIFSKKHFLYNNDNLLVITDYDMRQYKHTDYNDEFLEFCQVNELKQLDI